MEGYSVAVIGTGAAPGGSEDTGHAMGYRHGGAYERLDNCSLVACADLDGGNATRFASAFGIEETRAYTDHREMLRDEDLDVVSVTTPIPTHASIVLDCATEGDLRAIHCEKPMADTWFDAMQMMQACSRRDIQLTINHQLRHSEPARIALELIQDGTIGEIRRVEASRSDLFEAGIHQLDLCSYFTGDVPVSWVIGAIDYREEKWRNGVHIEGQALAHWEYENGVHGLVSTGHGADAIGVLNRIVGTAGEIEVDFWGEQPLRVRHSGEPWEAVECAYGRPLEDAIAHCIECLDDGTEPLLSARRTRIGTELAFGIYESARRRGRVDFPLDVGENPLLAMIESGELELREN